MHDPLVVAFEIRRPWPERVNWPHRRWYWPAIITVWHREPWGYDSGEVCKHYTRHQGADGVWRTRMRNRWRFHIHHWHIQVHPLQALRRWALTRCAWCGGRQIKNDPIDISHSWDGPRGHWWRGEPGLYHHDCSTIANAAHSCSCDDPALDSGTYGRCARCDKGRSYGRTPHQIAGDRLLGALPQGSRDPEAYAAALALYHSVATEGEVT